MRSLFRTGNGHPFLKDSGGGGPGQGRLVEVQRKLTEIPEVEQRADERQKEPKDRAAIGKTFTELAVSEKPISRSGSGLVLSYFPILL